MSDKEMASCNVGDEISGVSGNCALCDRVNVLLKESHVIPRFASQWVKETAKTPFLRSSENINERQQDGHKLHLLCGQCEEYLAGMEKELSEYLFKRLANYRQQKSFTLVSERARVAVLSIFWRALYTTRNRDADWTAEDKQAIDVFLSDSKADINAEKCRATIYLTPMFGTPPYYGLPREMTYMLERSLGHQDIRFFDDPHRYFAVFKLPFMFFHIFGGIWPESECTKSLILVADEIDFRNSNEMPEILVQYICMHYNDFEKNKYLMTEESKARIAEDAAKNKDVTGSDKSAERSGW